VSIISHPLEEIGRRLRPIKRAIAKAIIGSNINCRARTCHSHRRNRRLNEMAWVEYSSSRSESKGAVPSKDEHISGVGLLLIFPGTPMTAS